MCGCNKKRLVAAAAVIGSAGGPAPMRAAAVAATASLPVEIEPATVWGPALWSVLHCLASKTGRSGNQRIDSDEARYFENIIDQLYTVLPCAECQTHCKEYLSGPGRLHRWRGIYGESLRNAISTWLSDFHNAVRVKQEKEPMKDVDYSACTITEETMNIINTNMKNASSVNLVSANHLRRWTRNLTELKLLLGA